MEKRVRLVFKPFNTLGLGFALNSMQNLVLICLPGFASFPTSAFVMAYPETCLSAPLFGKENQLGQTSPTQALVKGRPVELVPNRQHPMITNLI